ncbi:MAG TPA: argininosuccinate lyase, partial [Burkholderiaceae bacterium]|nr:argininosuccinate lyase [Burkholderiaceae bacterium]
ARLVALVGDTGKKLHTGRSRNDQVATAFRLWHRDEMDGIDESIVGLQRSLIDAATRHDQAVLPGYTHLQRAQPVLAPHYWLAYCEKFDRDRSRLHDCRRRTNELSLGAAALAGTSLPIDRADVARRLGFETVAANSLDVSSDRDFVIEFAFVLAMISEHLSTWAEEWILWSTVEFGFLKLPQAYCTGSSIMPQKINPDVLELTRGKTARAIGNLQALLVLIKGLPLAYNRDLQEDKPRIFDSYDAVNACLDLAAPLVAGAELNRQAIADRLDRGHLDATTLMEHLIKQGMPQRSAHEASGRLVRKALDRGVRLSDLSLAEFQEVAPALDETVYATLGPTASVEAFTSYGSTAPTQVAQQVARWKEKLAHLDRSAHVEPGLQGGDFGPSILDNYVVVDSPITLNPFEVISSTTADAEEQP